MPTEKQLANLQPFKKGEVSNPTGRPKKLVTQLKGLGYSKDDINQTLMNMVAMSREELTAIDKSNEYTILERIVAGALLKSHDKNSLYSLETLLTRVHGKPKEEVETTIRTEEPIRITLKLD
jgi:hypothetical protein